MRARNIVVLVVLAAVLVAMVHIVLTALAIGATLHNVGRLLFEWRH